MITIKKIAELAGVSSATVSKVINGKDEHISDATRQNVLKIVEREGYIPNGIAKSLRVRNTKTIGLIIPDVMNPFFAELARGVGDAAEKRGYTVILCNTDNEGIKEDKTIKILQEKMVDGIIIAATENSAGKSLERCNIPLVLLDRHIELDMKVGSITVDNEKGGYIATEYLIGKGCNNISYISSKTSTKPSAERLEGYKRALMKNGIEFNEDITYYNNFRTETGYLGVLNVLDINKRIDGIFCGNDLIAIGAIKALKEKGIRVPEDVRVIGFDNISICDFIDPPLTTIRQPIYEMGEEAIEMLINIIENCSTGPNKVLSPTLIKRGSA